MLRLKSLFLLSFLFASVWTYSQTEAVRFQEHYDQARRYTDLSLFVEATEEFDAAIDIAEENGWLEKELQVKISLSELMRKTCDFEKGIELLEGLLNTTNYPKLHVRKLGRLAALYHEMPNDENPNAYHPIIEKLLREGIKIAEENDFKTEGASLKNELGFFISRNKDRKEGLKLIQEAARVFKENGDLRNYTNTMTHVVETSIASGNLQRADSVIQYLTKIVNGNEWYTTEIDLFNQIAAYHLDRGDSLSFIKWEHEAAKSFVKYNNSVHNDRMAAFRVLQDTRKYQDLADQRTHELEQESKRSRELFIYLAVTGLLVIGVVGLFIRERGLKQKVDIANEKYHMLIVESNHRIKNNLQMIISMLEYASKDIGSEDKRAMKRMSGKIHTISALHKHLYLDVHNERVDVDTYFSEIIKLYEDITADDFKVEKHIDKISIKSERIVYFGLILNELLANTIEHGNAESKGVVLAVKREKDIIRLNYQDGSSWEETEVRGTGRILIKQLVQRVGGFGYSVDSSKGEYTFLFNP